MEGDQAGRGKARYKAEEIFGARAAKWHLVQGTEEGREPREGAKRKKRNSDLLLLSQTTTK